jgi:ParB/RepB/Spo0J family partition protein
MGTAKQGLASLSVGRSDFFRIDPRVLKVRDGWNCREDYGDIDELAASIAEVGVKEPLTVVYEAGEAWVTDGHRRLKATLQAIASGAEIVSVPCKSEDRYSNDADRLFSQILRNSGKPFTALENAKVYQKLIGFGWTQADIAKKAGISQSRVSQVLELLTLPEGVKKLVTSGQVSASLAAATVSEHNPQKAMQILQDAVASAQVEGRTRATARDTGGEKKPGLAKVLKDAFEKADILEDFDGSKHKLNAKGVVVVFTEAQWELISKTLKF